MKISHFVFDLLFQRVTKILPPKQIAFLPNVLDSDKSWQPLCDLIFVIERFYNTKVLPNNYNIVYSSKFDSRDLSSDNSKSNLIIGKVKAGRFR